MWPFSVKEGEEKGLVWWGLRLLIGLILLISVMYYLSVDMGFLSGGFFIVLFVLTEIFSVIHIFIYRERIFPLIVFGTIMVLLSYFVIVYVMMGSPNLIVAIA